MWCWQHFRSEIWVITCPDCACANACRPWLNACRLCALVAEVSWRWRALFVHLPPWHEVHGAGESSSSESDGQPGELLVKQLAIRPGTKVKPFIISYFSSLTSKANTMQVKLSQCTQIYLHSTEVALLSNMSSAVTNPGRHKPWSCTCLVNGGKWTSVSSLFKQAFQSQSEFSQQQTWYSGVVTNQKIVTMSQAEQTISDVSIN